ncbi:hypothetical protein [Nannocystis sp. SCPEA4]|uniref:hypothetical protein n=1 Tax=Nannocystis sp. SCPEA4 TaxID=2996787 RepID=UPI00226FE0A5|nr:hypothetical protein [Nannocystis sp. SCPEA4]MCY1058197.1 hypothetical protein [Nannocystis sp. SCPEA4]
MKSSRSTADPEEDGLAALYGLPLAEFTTARDELAAKLRAAGDSAGATRVKSLRKPSTAVWAINQLARREPGRIAALLKAGERMRESQRAGSTGLREASEAHHQLVWELLQGATNVLAEAGIRAPGDHLDPIRITLQSAPAATEHEREMLREGTLTRELEPADISDVMQMMAGGAPEEAPPAAEIETPTRGRKPTKRKVTRERAKPSRRAAPRVDRAAKQEAARAAKAAAREQREAEREAARAAKAAAAREAREAEREAARAAKAAAREEREAEQAEARQQAAARRAYAKASREAEQWAEKAERAKAAARQADQLAHKAEEAARTARERADAAELAAEAAESRAEAAEAARVAAEQDVDTPGGRARGRRRTKTGGA